MRQNTRKKNGSEKHTLLAATLACYLAGFACVGTLAYSLAALTAPGLAAHARVAIERQARP